MIDRKILILLINNNRVNVNLNLGGELAINVHERYLTLAVSGGCLSSSSRTSGKYHR